VERSEPEVLPLLSEEGVRNDPDRIASTIAELLDDRRGALLCTHRPALEIVFAALAEVSSERVRDRLPTQDPWLAPAEVLVAHVRHDPLHSATDRLHTVERFRGESPRNTLG
jgi:8-oxo-dGTP diphosphatase